jgi:hypothetical protein
MIIEISVAASHSLGKQQQVPPLRYVLLQDFVFVSGHDFSRATPRPKWSGLWPLAPENPHES